MLKICNLVKIINFEPSFVYLLRLFPKSIKHSMINIHNHLHKFLTEYLLNYMSSMENGHLTWSLCAQNQIQIRILFCQFIYKSTTKKQIASKRICDFFFLFFCWSHILANINCFNSIFHHYFSINFI